MALLVERQNLFSGYDDSCFTEELTHKIFPSQVCLLVNNSSFQLNTFSIAGKKKTPPPSHPDTSAMIENSSLQNIIAQ